ncbi:MAG: helix-turn-helix transcriptional regulator [Lachnospiraceae bacterium]|nr:helix-turn-helix transcriptional regulator [Lachnospiraceae bacterium]
MKIHGTESNTCLMEEIGRRLRGLRVRSSMTQQELSTRAGVPKSMITKAENGTPIRMDVLVELMRALDCLGNLQMLLPEDELTALEMLKGKKSRLRVRHTKNERVKGSDWKWGDEV